MFEKLIRGLYNFIRITILRLRFRNKVSIPLIQPMRINSQLMLQNGIKHVRIGKGFRLETNAKVRVIRGGELEIGNNVFINCNSYITVLGKVCIDDGCLIGPGVMIFDHDHDYKAEGGVRSGGVIAGEISIGKNVWIGANSIILKGAVIHDDAVIAAGSIINKEIPAHTVVLQKRSTEIVSY